MKTAIDKIIFNVRGKKLELSKEEAMELKEILSDLFGGPKVVREYIPHYPYYTYPYWTITSTSGNLTDVGTSSYTLTSRS